VRVLLDENLPIDLVVDIFGHEVETVLGLGWAGIKNGELLQRCRGRFDALLTMDTNFEFQQPIARQPFGVILLRATSSRLVDFAGSRASAAINT
jgi:predicted nuclease of predicted toxin-antitoxin system